ncbi:serine hydrolase FSH [Aspergillus caelatus]|uniref:Serine hydrolase FSH n=1 Tax=Aspergillus caelatus TaxID=61420 RepID=A0A5N7AE24_9EURO|nr:serine hydrolase FSH [Aspergillus caelatus]KAE8368121.1 serine hydrolase FSH [Aspergillus caelatus]
MRFLCLHGGGTNAKIFEIQVGGLKQKLESRGYQLAFVNEHRTELQDIFDGPFYDHYPRGLSSPGPYLTASFAHVYRITSKTGPFDAVIGFSQGAALASALLIHHHDKIAESESLFKVGVSICAGTPYETSGISKLNPKPGTASIHIPTAHIVGMQDPLFEDGIKLYRLCEPSKVFLYNHGSKHMVPFHETTRA